MTVCSRPEDGLRYRQGVKPPLKLKLFCLYKAPMYLSLQTSPADGRVLHLGPVHRGVLEQVKGVSYSMKGFLGPLGGVTCLPAGSSDVTSDELYAQALTTRPRHKLWQIIIYLAPGDYHHFHSPADWEVQRRRHFPGRKEYIRKVG